MRRTGRYAGVLITFVLLLTGTPSWGGGHPTGNDDSDYNVNTGGGTSALTKLTTGSGNTAYGASALFSASGGHSNTALGVSALYENTIGSDNTALGGGALSQNTAGSNNTAVGRYALAFTTGSNNIALGYESGFNLATGSNNIAIGNLGMASDNGIIRLGTAGTHFAAFLAGVYGSPLTSGSPRAVYVNQYGRLGYLPSSAALKRDIEPVGRRSAGLAQLRPVRFRYRDAPEETPRFGLLAEEVAPIYPELVTTSPTGQVLGLDYPQLIPLLVSGWQAQQAELAAVKAEYETKLQALTAAQEQAQTELAAFKTELRQLRATLAPQAATFAAR